MSQQSSASAFKRYKNAEYSITRGLFEEIRYGAQPSQQKPGREPDKRSFAHVTTLRNL